MTKKHSSIRTSAKAIIIRKNHLLTVVKDYPGGIAFILPGGGQNHGESLTASLQRECQEEIGVQVEIGGLRFVREYIGKNHEHADTDSDYHVVECLFNCRIPDDYQAQLGSEPDFDQAGVMWLPLDELAQHQFYPAYLKEILVNDQESAIYLGDVN